MLLYFAAPLFSPNELSFNARLAGKIEGLGYDVFLPQRDGYEGTAATEGFEAWSEAIFERDKNAVLASDVLLCILDGRVPDEGMAVELGLGYADRIYHNAHRKLIGFSTDQRIFSAAGINAMLAGALDEVHHDERSLLQRLQMLVDAAD